MKTLSNLTAAIATLFVMSAANAGDSYRFQCESQELGVTEITLSNPVQETIGCSYFDIDLNRSDISRTPVETRHQPEKDSWTAGNFDARYCRGEAYVTIRFPTTKVDWSAHANECWVNGTLAGTTVSLELATGKVLHTYEGHKTYYALQELNPRADFRWVDNGGPFRVLVPFLNGQQCARVSATKDASTDPVCKRLN